MEQYLLDVVEYYNNNITKCLKNISTVTHHYKEFEKYLSEGDKILDIGCGIGRDMSFFKEHGYNVEGIDISAKMCEYAKLSTGCKVFCDDILNIKPCFYPKYDAVWANSSLIHVKYKDLPIALNNIYSLLKENGIAYISFKHSASKRYKYNSLSYTDMTHLKMIVLLSKVKKFRIIKEFYTVSVSEQSKDLYNVILKK